MGKKAARDLTGQVWQLLHAPTSELSLSGHYPALFIPPRNFLCQDVSQIRVAVRPTEHKSHITHSSPAWQGNPVSNRILTEFIDGKGHRWGWRTEKEVGNCKTRVAFCIAPSLSDRDIFIARGCTAGLFQVEGHKLLDGAFSFKGYEYPIIGLREKKKRWTRERGHKPKVFGLVSHDSQINVRFFFTWKNELDFT